ncbi:unnamed protein product [Tuber aestivum]|uniref:Uncharacterized protein n=1 Tax=Tuber aestivum TaxID=59557 RepID=A0A292PNX7_9PEZI|nr:unnamed protein product [Tuber aestivum]
MEYQPDARRGQHEPQHHFGPPNISPAAVSDTPRPTRRSALPPSISPGISRGHLRRFDIPDEEGKSSVFPEQVPPAGDPQPQYTRDCVKRFQDWRSEKGNLASRGGREGGLDIEISLLGFLSFKKALHIDDDHETARFPKYSYDSFTSVLTIQCMPSVIHEQVVSTISEGLTLARSHLPTYLQQRIDIVGNQNFTNFHGAYHGSEKTPDTALKIEDSSGNLALRFILEVGLAETYEKLVRDASLWLDGTETVSAVMLVKLVEDPGYQCPTQLLSDQEFAQQGFLRPQELNLSTFALHGSYGPAVYKGFTWVGSVSGFIEIWKRDRVSGLASRTRGPLNLLSMADSTAIDFWMSDFIDIPPEDDQPILCKWGNFLNNLGRYIRELAADRCRRALIDREGRMNILDRDYQPSHSVDSP